MIYIFIMVIGSHVHFDYHNTVITAEFNTIAACHVAMQSLASKHNGEEFIVRAQGCYEKGKAP